MISLVLGGQFGGEGKGKVSAYLALRNRFAAICRAGGVNCSHTIVESGEIHRLRLMPGACVGEHCARVVFGAGALLHVDTLFDEIRELRFDVGKLAIDRRAGIVPDALVAAQRADGRYSSIGSTLTGTGYATAERSLRRLSLAESVSDLRPFLCDASTLLGDLIKSGQDILIEGHQAFGLSNYHGDYPYCTSRDTTAAAHLSELGIGPRWSMEIVLVVKAFPTRNHAGSLANELSRTEMDEVGIAEFGGGSWGIPDRRRRVGRLDLQLLSRACLVNTPTVIALTGADYLDPAVLGAVSVSGLSGRVLAVVRMIENCTGVPVRYVSTGRETGAMVDLVDPVPTGASLLDSASKGGAEKAPRVGAV